jgi:hypothetical protein
VEQAQPSTDVERSKGWCCWIANGDGENIHIIPEDDLIAHEFSDECVCIPYTIYNEDSVCRNRIVHSSLDGRELIESDSI